MAIEVAKPTENVLLPIEAATVPPPPLAALDASKLKFTPTANPKSVPTLDKIGFGQHTTDHMLVINFDPQTGWSDPEIRPFAPLSLSPLSSCFQYATNVFEGMKAFKDPDGKPRLFRPKRNMERFVRSAARVALPTFDPDELLKCLLRLVSIDERWIPTAPERSLYIRPTIIGTRAALGVVASDSCMLFIVMSPCGPLFRSSTPSLPTSPSPGPTKSLSTPRSKSISLLAVSSHVRAWPGGTGSYKLSGNYAPGFQPQEIAKKLGYEQVLWLFEDKDKPLPAGEGHGKDWKITEVGAMNFFILLSRPDGHLDLLTPSLDGTILAGITRASILDLAASHSPSTPLDGLSPDLKIYTQERSISLSDLVAWSDEGRLLEAWAVGTAIVMAPVGKIGIQRTDHDVAPMQNGSDIEVDRTNGAQHLTHEKVLILPKHESDINGMGPVGRAVKDRLVAIQEGRFEWKDWSVVCE